MSLQNPPFLLPQNRKLRHLRGVYLRNLTLSKPRRGQVFDDASINKSPEKLESLRQGPSVHRAHSSDDISAERVRSRRVTLSSVTSHTRQQVLEAVFERTSLDAFFTLHASSSDEPVYISEVEEKATNFNFRFFDLSNLDSLISRSSQLVVKVWVCRQSSWSLLLEDEVDLRFLGTVTSLQENHYPSNCILFHLIDGMYTFNSRSRAPLPKQGPALPSSSYTALMKLSNLESSIHDSLATQDMLAAHIEGLLKPRPSCALSETREAIRRLNKGIAHQKRLLAAASKKHEDTLSSISERSAAIAAGRALQQKACNDVEHATTKLASSRATLMKTMDDIRGQRRRICSDLMSIFPISPAPSNQPLSFQICGMSLPNTEYGSVLAGSSSEEDIISSALGYVALLVNMLQGYLGVALPYTITPFGSRSMIRDNICKIPELQRDFPLYLPKGGPASQYRFDYGWFLLNKNIETLCSVRGLKIVDIRHTLPNLKYLLYVCSSGSDALPQRKKGDVRGLSMPQLQRPDTATSSIIDGSDLTIKYAKETEDSPATPRSADFMPDVGSKGTVVLPFDEFLAPSLRTRGLRENV